MYTQFNQSKAVKQKILVKQIDSFKIKFDKNVINYSSFYYLITCH